ncbi:hypothetical protein DSM104443_01771 [Usitatibacter rugosus]|uniref:Uncharacterized protein n=1 Tax=Usitatibacter rugosus TaxID=2732067 RepID=A0A6M4GW33_9PROT|nr:hypothetical protein [Usitatibacter rugosus]QJR10704.1 hypothetical protein DSM104443_01771 [Usitatibacter rugosus]
MEPEILSIASYLGLWFVVYRAIRFLFDRAEADASPAMRTDWIRWIHRDTPQRVVNRLPKMFIETFDRLFGYRAFSFGFFLRSSVVTVVALSMLLLAWAAFRPDQAVQAAVVLVKRDGSLLGLLLAIVLWLIFATLLNVIPDYLSVVKSRALIGAAARTSSSTKFVGLVLADIALSALLGLLATALVAYVVWLFFPFYLPNFGSSWKAISTNLNFSFITFQDFLDILSLKANPGIQMTWVFFDSAGVKQGEWKETGGNLVPIGVNFYATFFTTLWMGIFMSATSWVRIYPRALAIGDWFRRAFNVNEKPFQSLGTMIAVWASVGFLIGLVLLLVARF